MSQDLKNKVIAYLQALEKTDWVAARAMCDETATVWHNDGKGDETLEQYIEGLKKQIGLYESIHYDIIRQLSQPGGVLQQHVVRVTAKNGERGGVHAAVYFAFNDAGLIIRIEAYASYIPEGQSS